MALVVASVGVVVVVAAGVVVLVALETRRALEDVRSLLEVVSGQLQAAPSNEGLRAWARELHEATVTGQREARSLAEGVRRSALSLEWCVRALTQVLGSGGRGGAG
jgi:hypothetical protein